MVAKKMKKQKGQAIFELIIFLPIFLFLMKTLFDYGDAINHSINQNKAVRSYYFYTAANDSNLPNLAYLGEFQSKSVKTISLDTFSWSTQTVPDESAFPMGSCVKVPGFLGNDLPGECDAPQPDDMKSQFIRVYTSFGVCTGSWASAEDNSAVSYALDWPRAADALCQRSTR